MCNNNSSTPVPPTYMMQGHIAGFPHRTASLPAGLSSERIIDEYPNHLRGPILIQLYKDGFTAAKIADRVARPELLSRNAMSLRMVRALPAGLLGRATGIPLTGFPAAGSPLPENWTALDVMDNYPNHLRGEVLLRIRDLGYTNKFILERVGRPELTENALKQRCSLAHLKCERRLQKASTSTNNGSSIGVQGLYNGVEEDNDEREEVRGRGRERSRSPRIETPRTTPTEAYQRLTGATYTADPNTPMDSSKGPGRPSDHIQGYPWRNEDLPDGLNAKEIMTQYPNHVRGEVLLWIRDQGYSAKEIASHVPSRSFTKGTVYRRIHDMRQYRVRSAHRPPTQIPGFPLYDLPLPPGLSNEDIIDYYPNHLRGPLLLRLFDEGWGPKAMAERVARCDFLTKDALSQRASIARRNERLGPVIDEPGGKVNERLDVGSSVQYTVVPRGYLGERLDTGSSIPCHGQEPDPDLLQTVLQTPSPSYQSPHSPIPNVTSSSGGAGFDLNTEFSEEADFARLSTNDAVSDSRPALADFFNKNFENYMLAGISDQHLPESGVPDLPEFSNGDLDEVNIPKALLAPLPELPGLLGDSTFSEGLLPSLPRLPALHNVGFEESFYAPLPELPDLSDMGGPQESGTITSAPLSPCTEFLDLSSLDFKDGARSPLPPLPEEIDPQQVEYPDPESHEWRSF
ncbi:MAG: hypothetical protein M1827_005613 [Pycnora praestabilis]|nr:MAG: hypothetical protein M1827_005613 [Pycnora praestabilis]